MHSLLKRQLKRCFEDEAQIPEQLRDLIDAVDSAYREFDDDRSMLERSLDLSSRELLQANAEIHEQADEALRESERRLRALFETSVDAITLADAEGNFVTCNKQAASLLGFENPDELIGRNYTEFMSPEGQQKALEYAPKILEEGGAAGIEYTMNRRDGTPVSIEMSVSVIRDAGGQPQAYATVARDIGTRKQAEEALRESEQRYRSLIESSPDAIVVYVVQGVITLANEAAARLIGATSSQDVTGRTVWDFVHPDYLEEITRRGREMIAQGKSAPAAEVKLVRIDGAVIDAELTAGLVSYEGRPAIQVAIRDVSERKQAQEQISRLSREREAITQGVQDIIYVVSPEAKIVWWNKRFQDVTGLSSEELQDRPAINFFPPEDQPLIAQRIRQVFEDGYAEAEAHFLTVAGPVSYHFNGVILKDDDGNIVGLTGVGRDISERQRNEEAAQRWTSLYQSLFQAQSNLGEGIAIMEGERIVFANDALSNIYGYTPTELLAIPSFHDLVVPEKRSLLAGQPYGAPTEPSGAGHGETVILNKSGNRVNIEYSFIPISTGDRAQLFTVVRDVTERRRAEEALRYSEALTRQIIDTAYDAFIAIDEGGVITDWNSRAEVIFGWPRQVALGRVLAETIIPQGLREAHKRGLAHFLATGEGPVLNQRIELSALHRDGHEFPVELTISPAQAGDRYTFNAFVRDISERKRAAEELARHADELEQFNRLAVGRELRMVELKRQVNDLAKATGQDPPYDLSFERAESPAGSSGSD